MLKREMARELDSLRHKVSQQAADIERLQAQRKPEHNVVNIGRAALMQRAKELSIAAGVTHRVNGERIEAFDPIARIWM